MKIRPDSSMKRGSALLVTMLLLSIGMVFVGLYLGRITHELKLSRKQIDYQQACLLAESGLDYGVLRLKDLVMDYQFAWSSNYLQTRLDAIAPPPDVGDFRYRTPGGQPAFRIQASSPVVNGVITNGAVCRGSEGSFQYFTITCGVARDGGAAAVIKQTVQSLSLPLIRFGVFYDPDLEILPGPSMWFHGPVHVNGNLYVGGPLEFHDRVTAHGNILHHRKDDPTLRPGETRIITPSTNLVSMIQGGAYIDSDSGDWMTRSIELWRGNCMSSAHGIPDLSPPINPVDDNHDIIERPNTTGTPVGFQRLVSTNEYSPLTEGEKFANKACLKIHIGSNGVLTATDYHGTNLTAAFTNAVLLTNGNYIGRSLFAKEGDGTYRFATNGAYDVTQTNFYDARQRALMMPVDIYVDQLLSNFPALYDGTYGVDQGRAVVYVTRDDPDGVGTGKQPCVRLRNGRDLSASPYGLSFASDLPVYVEGNYNTSNTRPALVAGDAVTMLSTNWNDAYSDRDSTAQRRAGNTTYNTVVMTGCRNTAAGDYNGGLENVLRFLEDWSSRTARFRGSIIDLWFSETATNRWYYGDGAPDGLFRYNAPNRDWGYDPIYRTQAPPGMTRVFGMEELDWIRTTWAAEGW